MLQPLCYIESEKGFIVICDRLEEKPEENKNAASGRSEVPEKIELDASADGISLQVKGYEFSILPSMTEHFMQTKRLLIYEKGECSAKLIEEVEVNPVEALEAVTVHQYLKKKNLSVAPQQVSPLNEKANREKQSPKNISENERKEG